MNASAHLVTLFDVGSHAPRGSSSESPSLVIHVHVRLSLSSSLSLSTSICPSPSSPSSSFSCTSSRHTELDNLVAMQNLRTSANNVSNDAYDVHTSLTSIGTGEVHVSRLLRCCDRGWRRRFCWPRRDVIFRAGGRTRPRCTW